MAHTLRTRFKKEIIAEFLPPAKKTKRARVVIICGGMPGLPSARRLVEFFSEKGFWAIYPRYRGSWESRGIFLRKSPEEDVRDIIDELPRGFTDLWSMKKYRVRPDELYVLASSFGGPAGILVSRDKRVKKVVAICPVVDWLAPSKTESLEFMEEFVPRAFGEGYRFGKKEWRKLSTGKFYNPVHHENEIDGSKLFIIHAKDDDVVRFREVAQFAKNTGSKCKPLKRGGHLRMADTAMKYWPEIARFFRA